MDKELNYELAFGQHSGVIDKSKDLFELPRYPVNDLKASSTVIKTFRSFYDNGWKILKEKKIPFILFFNTREVNANNPNYMTWDQIREIHNSKLELSVVIVFPMNI